MNLYASWDQNRLSFGCSSPPPKGSCRSELMLCRVEGPERLNYHSTGFGAGIRSGHHSSHHSQPPTSTAFVDCSRSHSSTTSKGRHHCSSPRTVDISPCVPSSWGPHSRSCCSNPSGVG